MQETLQYMFQFRNNTYVQLVCKIQKKDIVRIIIDIDWSVNKMDEMFLEKYSIFLVIIDTLEPDLITTLIYVL